MVKKQLEKVKVVVASAGSLGMVNWLWECDFVFTRVVSPKFKEFLPLKMICFCTVPYASSPLLDQLLTSVWQRIFNYVLGQQSMPFFRGGYL